MAHNLAVDKNGVVSMAYNKQNGTPWHNLGYAADGAMSTLEALQRGGLSYIVDKRPMFIETKDGSKLLVPDKQAVIRTDDERILGVVGNRYEVIQNNEAFNFFDSFINEGEAIIDTVGALGNGEKVWIMAAMPNDLLINKDQIKTYLLLHTTHDGSSTLKIRFVAQRVVCQNTLVIALKENADIEVSIRHTQNAADKLEMAHKTLGIVKRQYAVAQSNFDKLAKFDVNEMIVDSYVHKLYPIKEGEAETTRGLNIRKEVKDLIYFGKGNTGTTAWDCYNGAMEFIDFKRSVRGAADNADNESSLRWESATFGSGYGLKVKAFKEAMALTTT